MNLKPQMNADERRLEPLPKALVVGRVISAAHYLLRQIENNIDWFDLYLGLDSGVTIRPTYPASVMVDESLPLDAKPFIEPAWLVGSTVEKVNVSESSLAGLTSIEIKLDSGNQIYVVHSAPSEVGGVGVYWNEVSTSSNETDAWDYWMNQED